MLALTLLMSTTKDSNCVSGGSWGWLRMIQCEVVINYVCASANIHTCVKTHKGEVEVTLGLPCPFFFFFLNCGSLKVGKIEPYVGIWKTEEGKMLRLQRRMSFWDMWKCLGIFFFFGCVFEKGDFVCIYLMGSSRGFWLVIGLSGVYKFRNAL